MISCLNELNLFSNNLSDSNNRKEVITDIETQQFLS